MAKDRIKRILMISLVLFCWLCASAAYSQSLEEAEGLNEQVLQLIQQGRYQEAIPLAERALAIRERALGLEHTDVAVSLNNLALLYTNLGDYTRAEPLLKRSLAINEKVYGPNHPEVDASLNNLAFLYFNLGDYARAEPLLKRSLAINEKVYGPNHPEVATSLNNLAVLYKSLGDYARAEPLYKRSLTIRERALGKDHPDLAGSLNNLGGLYYELGDYAQAELLLKRSLAILERALGKDHPDVASSLSNLATLYDSLGDYARAEPLLKRSLAIRERALGKEHPDVAISLNELAVLYYYRGDYARAEPLYKRSLAIWERALGKDHPYVDAGLGNLAAFYMEAGRWQDAFEIAKGLDNHLGLGRCYLAQGEDGKAEKEFLSALELSKKRGELTYIIADYIGLGLTCEGQRDYTRAKGYFQQAIGHINQQWASLGLAARQNFLAGKVGAGFSRLEPYEGMIRILIKEKKGGYEEKSLLVAERVKSRTFLERLAARGVQGRGKADRVVLKKDREFQRDISMLRKRIETLGALGAKAPAGERERLEKELKGLQAKYEEFIRGTKLKAPELASLISEDVISVGGIQSLLGPETTLVEYYTAKDRTYAWLITKGKTAVYEIDIKRKDLEGRVNQFLLPNISNKSRRPEPVMGVAPGGGYQKKASKEERKQNRERFSQAAKGMYDLIVAPISGGIKTNRLLIVPHGVLHKVPFAALTDGESCMVDRYAISVLPAAGVMKYITDKRNPDKGRLVAFANPTTDYVPLGFAEAEVEGIAGVFGKKEVYTGDRATEGVAKGKAAYPDVIHFACHGEFNEQQPMQSGLLLARDRTNDGHLQVHELFGLDLKEANLVALSACETALAKVQGGDDLVGLSRGFIYAGTPSLLATLWEVDDRSTSIVMRQFYENWRKKGMEKPEALRRAQLALKKTPGYEHPFYWAPFVIIGDWQ